MRDDEYPEEDSQPKDEVPEHMDDTVKVLPLGEELQSLTEELEASKARAQENWDRLLRMQAENDNLQKRSERDIENAHKYALEGFAKDLLPVKDSLEMGLAAAQNDSDEGNIKEGTEMTLKMFTEMFEKHGLEVIDPEGEPFNPDHHQAMSMQEDAELEPNTVTTVMQKGYLLNDRLIRPAMVIVSKLPG